MRPEIGHNPEYERLETLSDWELENEDQDIRGRPLVTPEGEEIGVIDELLVDREQERVAAVRLDDGRATGVEHLELGPDRVVWHETAPPTGTSEQVRGSERISGQEEEVVPIVEEEVAIGKRPVEQGGIRVHSRVVEDTVAEDVRLRDEYVDVERRDAGRRITGEEAEHLMEDRTVEMTERTEEPVVDKRAVVKEEVAVSKHPEERTERVEEDVRRTEVDVEREPERKEPHKRR